MRNRILLLGFIIILASFTPTNKSFEGKIIYKMEVEGDFMSMLKSYLPESYIFSFKDENTKIEIKGGLLEMVMGTILITHSGERYMLNAEKKTATKLPVATDDSEIEKTEPPKVTQLNETETILGYQCQKYKIVYNEGGNEVTQYLWATPDINLKLNGMESAGIPGTFNFNGINAFPLTIEMVVNQMRFDMNLLLYASSIKKEKFKKSDFEIPSDYSIKEFDNNILNS